ncbi:CopL family metal-binding regulatory protein [Lysobacter ruishenii]|uniref:CopL family metal-binding regulatory protein n=1 Tax=Aerolutibacter ruishenii TaxID=686800 RepID=UPI0011A72411
MAWSALALRCLLIVAFCLDGGLSLWKASAMAVRMAETAPVVAASDPAAHHGDGQPQAASGACETEGTFLLPDGDHDDCDCQSMDGCKCPCTFAVKLIVYKILPALPQRLSMRSAAPLRVAVARTQTSAVFRPPIG